MRYAAAIPWHVFDQAYRYDSLNRLIEEYHLVDENDDGLFDLGTELRADFRYTLRADGKRVRADEFFIDPLSNNPLTENHYFWDYDAAGRLVGEFATNIVHQADPATIQGFEDYTLIWKYDLAGNRLSQLKDFVSSPDETTTYTFDANDRIVTESLSVAGGATTSSLYSFVDPVTSIDGTQQHEKTTSVGATQTKSQTMEYDLQGRMSSVRIETTTGGATSVEVTDYTYDSNGNRVKSVHKVDSNNDSVFETEVATEYLTDSQSLTGYSQVLRETEFDGAENEIKRTVYTIGHDQISQTVQEFDSNTNQWENKGVRNQILTFGVGIGRLS